MTRPILYHCEDARSLRCLWAAEEVGLEIDLRTLPFPPRAFAPEYRAVNPMMTVPGWVEDGQLLTESAAICPLHQLAPPQRRDSDLPARHHAALHARRTR